MGALGVLATILGMFASSAVTISIWVAAHGFTPEHDEISVMLLALVGGVLGTVAVFLAYVEGDV